MSADLDLHLDLNLYLDAVLGDTEGYLHTATGIGPHFDDRGKYKHRRWSDKYYRWPEQRAEAVAALLAAAEDSDVYVCPYLMVGDKRAQGAAVARSMAHADVDGELDLDKARQLGAFVIGSGTAGHGHAYVWLTESVPAQWHRALCRGLGAYLGDADAKIADNDVLRPPGTWNHKDRARGDRPTAVQWLERPDGTAWEPRDLAAMLDVTLPEQGVARETPKPKPGTATPEPVNLDNWPGLRAVVDKDTGDRSADTMRIVGACVDAGLTESQTLRVVRSRSDLAGRLDERQDDDVAACYTKAVEKRRALYSDVDADQLSDQTEHADSMNQAVEYRMTRMRVDREARRRLDAEDNPPPQLPAVKPLDVLLAEADSPTRYRIDGLQPIASRALLAAQYKAGKTTMVANVIRALVDGELFLGAFKVVPVRRLVLLDDELGEDMQRRWLRAQGIVNTAAVADVVSLRGRLSTFNPTDDRNRAQWATRLRDLGTDYLGLDCLSPLLAAHGIEENDPGEFLVGFDALMAEAGIEDSLVVHHMGHTGERSRGGSRLQDWPDAIWRVVRENDDPASPRYFSAYGRDVDVREGRLSFDPTSRRLTYAAGSRGDAKTEAALRGVVELLAAHARAGGPGLSGRYITDELGGEHTQKAIRAAAKLAVDRGLVAVEPGERNAKLHRIAKPCSQCGGPMAAGQTERHKSCDQAAEEMAA